MPSDSFQISGSEGPTMRGEEWLVQTGRGAFRNDRTRSPALLRQIQILTHEEFCVHSRVRDLLPL